MLILSGERGGEKLPKKTLNKTKAQTKTRQKLTVFIRLEFKSQSKLMPGGGEWVRINESSNCF